MEVKNNGGVGEVCRRVAGVRQGDGSGEGYGVLNTAKREGVMETLKATMCLVAFSFLTVFIIRFLVIM